MWMAAVASIARAKATDIANKVMEMPQEIENFLADLTGAAGAFIGLDVDVKPMPESLETAAKQKSTPAPTVPPAPSKKSVRPTL